MAEGTGQIFGTLVFLLMLLGTYLRKRLKQREDMDPAKAPETRKEEPSTSVAGVLARPVGFAPIAILAVIALVVAYFVIDSPELKPWLLGGILLVPVVYLVYKLRDYDLDVRRRS